ncbi:unnamed protein product [Mytilus coruscus]|uniref:CCHC-type domain-containing protein n=1 Tax=Mytilus coruscus TaxID=42192 RepID=A0A6J8EI66_MYTCO|nr:unnamed protein product [Mytilus coruscus]
MIGHPKSMFQPPRGGPPSQAPTNLPPYNEQYIPGSTYPSLGQPNLSGYQPQPLNVPYQQLPIPCTQQQPPTSGAPQPHYNQPSARPKKYNSDYYVRQRRSDPGHKYTGDSDTSDVSAYRQTRNKRRSEPEYNRPLEDQQRDFSPIRSVRSSPLHHSRGSPRRSRGSYDSQSESDTDGRCSKSSRRSRKKKDKIEKRQFLSSIPKTLRYSGKYNFYSPRRNYGRGRGRENNSGDSRYTRRGYYNNECFNFHKQGHYIKDCPDLYVQDTGSRQSVQKEPISQQVSFNENSKDDFYESEGVVSGISTVKSLGAAKLFRVEVDIAGKKVLALVDSGS